MTHLRTRAVHAGQHPDPGTGAIATPISQTTAFGYGTLEHGAAIFAGEAPGYRYSRFANPTLAALEAKMVDLEGAQAAVAFASGTAATSSVVLGLLNPGDEIAFLGPLYGGTEAFFRSLGERFGIRVVDATQQGLAASLTPATRMVWVETLINPSLHLHDLAEVADNTFCTPCLARPLEHGIDLVMHSMTKYLGGHGDATGGIVAGPAALIASVRKIGLGHVGGQPVATGGVFIPARHQDAAIAYGGALRGRGGGGPFPGWPPCGAGGALPGSCQSPAACAGAAPIAGRLWRHGGFRAGAQRALCGCGRVEPAPAIHPGGLIG